MVKVTTTKVIITIDCNKLYMYSDFSKNTKSLREIKGRIYATKCHKHIIGTQLYQNFKRKTAISTRITAN